MAERYVEFGRWDEAHRAMQSRLIAVESDLHDLRGAEQEHRSIEDRISALESELTDREKGTTARRDRIWVLGLTLVSGVIFPILVTAVITFLHLRSYH